RHFRPGSGRETNGMDPRGAVSRRSSAEPVGFRLFGLRRGTLCGEKRSTAFQYRRICASVSAELIFAPVLAFPRSRGSILTLFLRTLLARLDRRTYDNEPV